MVVAAWDDLPDDLKGRILDSRLTTRPTLKQRRFAITWTSTRTKSILAQRFTVALRRRSLTTPGKSAKSRLVTNAGLLRLTIMAFIRPILDATGRKPRCES